MEDTDKWFVEISDKTTKIWRTIYTERGGYVAEEFEFALLDDGTFSIGDCERDSVYMSKEIAQALYAFLAAQLKPDDSNPLRN